MEMQPRRSGGSSRMSPAVAVHISRSIDYIYRVLVIAGVVIAVFAVIRDYQTRNLIDAPARKAAASAQMAAESARDAAHSAKVRSNETRDTARQVCTSDNDRWTAYFDKVTAIANKRRPDE